MIVVSGCPRSGTSLMMNCLRNIFGDERIMGGRELSLDGSGKTKKPKKSRSPRAKCVEYLRGKGGGEGRKRKRKAEREKSKNMNPDGFWECAFTVGGAYYRMGRQKLLERLEAPSDQIVKIVCQGLARTDPRYVDSVILMLRDPHEVATSQERLNRSMPFEVGESNDMSEHLRIHSPVMFINVWRLAARWFSLNPDIPVKVVEYEELVNNWRTLKEVTDFLGEGKHKRARKVIKKKLHRSARDEEDSGPLWGEADHVHSLVKRRDWEGILKFLDDPKLECHYGKISFPCPRYGFTTDPVRCARCADAETRKRFQITADRRKIEWWREPCLWECGMNPRMKKPLTIKKSVAKVKKLNNRK